ncbi:nuclear transport factor 2 family protein [Sphingobium sp.]|uniref:nuclear transport factor 2 family protein n=1 Tax=Sphingobium sp. TaxID=1912891 RepID=UPI002CCFDC22|nr:nuclear transport factor 2 family protein [Sphingobium sp.]HUD92946.1 nuclear transport factor 2 family protein [Sphingobium sp.]
MSDRLEFNKGLVKRYLDDGMTENRVAVWSEILHEDFTFWGVPTSPASGTRNREQMLEGFGSLFDRIESVNLYIDDMIAEGDRVVVEAHSHCPLKNGKVYENDYAFLYKIKDDKIIEMREFLSTEALNILVD